MVFGLLLLLIWTALAAWGLTPLLASTLAQGGLVRSNYQERQLPVAVGLAFLLPALVSAALASGVGWIDRRLASTWIAASLGMALVGLLDDAAGNHLDRGWRGHLRAWHKEGRLSTGLLKAAVGGLVGLWVAGGWPVDTRFSLWGFRGGAGQLPSRLVLAMVLALSSNTFNLLDLRPGRAAKAFLGLAGLPLGISLLTNLVTWAATGVGYHSVPGLPGSLLSGPALWNQQSMWLLAGAAVALAAYAPGDGRGELMMGDSGANVLGLWAGWVWAALLPSWSWWLVASLLVSFHWYCERHSLSDWIARHPFWRRLDEWGR